MPKRTCLGCRRVLEKEDIVRFVSMNGVLTLDIRGILPGRGAYLCRDLSCVEKAKGRDAFSRALGARVLVPDPGSLWQGMNVHGFQPHKKSL